MSEKVDFLYKAIEDSQSTIKAIDVKLGFLFLIIGLPIVELEKIINFYFNVVEIGCLLHSVFTLSGALWGMGLWSLFVAVRPISNPGLNGFTSSAKGRFYNGDLYSMSFMDLFFNRAIYPRVSKEKFIDSLPNDEAVLVSELSVEVYKLVYIRDVKLYRASKALEFAFWGFSLGLLGWIIYFLGAKNA